MTGWIYCKKKKIDFLNFADYAIPYLALSQAIGRWGNFINQEAYGSVTESFLKMRIFSEEVGSFINVHPTFLYESTIDFLLFLLLMRMCKKRKWKGQLVYIYFIIYGIGRFFIEGLRADSLMLGSVRVSQIVSVILVWIGCIGIFVECRRRKDKNVD